MKELKKVQDFLSEVKDYYTIDTMGNIYSVNLPHKAMKTRNKKDSAYQLINLKQIAGGTKTYIVHRLVALAFLENDLNLPEVNHKNGDKTDNKLSNLEWCSPSENQKHAYQTGLSKARKGSKSNFSKLSEEDIDKIFKLREQGLTQKEIGEQIGCTRSNISYILNNKTWKI